MHDDNHARRAGDRAWQRALTDPRSVVYAVVGAVAVFCFVVSYSHIYDLGRLHAQAGTAARLLPLSVDGLIIAATLVLFIQGASPVKPSGLGRWLPRLTLWAAIAATVLANVAYGMPHGWESAVLSGWPGAAFVAAVEIGIVAVRMVPQTLSQNENRASVVTVQGDVPANVGDAARLALDASVAGGNALTAGQLVARFGITRTQARKLVAERAPSPPAGVALPSVSAQPPAPGGAPAGTQLNGHASG